jgi:prefoldin alpha subunit
VSCFAETPLLIPLTTSLYVPATLASGPPDSSSSSSEKFSSAPSVLVDIGTGFFVEKSPEDGIKFYKGKVDDLTKNLVEIEKAVGGKNENLRLIEDGK